LGCGALTDYRERSDDDAFGTKEYATKAAPMQIVEAFGDPTYTERWRKAFAR